MLVDSGKFDVAVIVFCVGNGRRSWTSSRSYDLSPRSGNRWISPDCQAAPAAVGNVRRYTRIYDDRLGRTSATCVSLGSGQSATIARWLGRRCTSGSGQTVAARLAEKIRLRLGWRSCQSIRFSPADKNVCAPSPLQSLGFPQLARLADCGHRLARPYDRNRHYQRYLRLPIEATPWRGSISIMKVHG
jgi:hypothetical protein